MITYNFLRDYFHYDPLTGTLTQRISGYPTYRKAGDTIGILFKEGYKKVTIEGKSYKTATLAYLYMTGDYPPKGMLVDHVDENKANDIWTNLRLANTMQNKQNVGINTKVNTSGVKGVCWHRRNNKWIAQLKVNKTIKHIGYFTDLEEAKKAIILARSQLHGEFANHG